MDELTDAIGNLKNGKARGASGILPEMVKAACCEDDFLELLLDLVQATWKEGEVPGCQITALRRSASSVGYHNPVHEVALD